MALLQNFKRPFPVVAAFIIAALCLITFLVSTDMVFNPLVLYGSAMFLLVPYRTDTAFINRFIMVFTTCFVVWVLAELGLNLLPFGMSFLAAYLLDPLVTKLSKRKVPRWLIALIFVLTLLGGVVIASVFLLPLIFSQLNQITTEVSGFVTQTRDFLESKSFYDMLESWGISPDTVRTTLEKDVAPRAEEMFKALLTGLSGVLTSISVVVTQLINLIILPILTFYFLKDMPQVKKLVKDLLGIRNARAVTDLVRINKIIRTYISWQVTAAMGIAIVSTTAFWLLGVPYPYVIGVIAGLSNPIPYVGSLISMVVGVLISLLVQSQDALPSIVAVLAVINSIHFLNAYFIEPRVLGNKVGVHPIILLFALFGFGHFFGIVGMIIAVPTTAVIVMFFDDWYKNRAKRQETEDAPAHIIVVPDAPSTA